MVSRPADWHLLFGLLALQNGLISREQLVVAFSAWTSDKTQAIDQLLVRTGALDESVRQTLQAMVDLHVDRHGGDVLQSLAALSGSDLPGARQSLEALGDGDLNRSMAELASSPFAATLKYSIGTSTSRGERFQILRPLPGGRGGMGVISVARDEELGREVALKQIQPDKADEEGYRQKFVVEAEITGNLEHPGIVPIYGLGMEADGRPYYAMRLVEGDNLADHIRQFHEARREGRLELDSVEFRGLVDKLIDVSQAIDYAHSRGVLHRDLKPGNILVGKYGETLVIDWGLARLPKGGGGAKSDGRLSALKSERPLTVRGGSEVAQTVQGSFYGTPGYAPPEQALGRTEMVDQRSDVYSLGAILYQVLTGRPPIEVEKRNLEDVLKDTSEGRIKPPRELERRVPKALQAICLKSLSREPDQRYASAKELVDELERWKADQPVEALPESWPARLKRYVRRHRGIAATIAAAIVVVAGVASFGYVQSREREVASTTAQRVSEFLVHLFRSPDPLGFAAGANFAFVTRSSNADDITARELLRRGAERIEQELEEEPEVRASLMETIGGAYRELGLYQEASDILQKAYDIRRTQVWGDDAKLASTMHNLAWALHYSGSYGEAEPLYREALQIRIGLFGRESLDSSSTMQALALLLTNLRRYAEAEQFFDEVIAIRRKLLGVTHQGVAIALAAKAALLLEMGNEDDAHSTIVEAGMIFDEHEKGGKAGKALMEYQQGAAALASGEYVEAARLLKSSVQVATEVLGDVHPFVAWAMHDYARALRLSQNYAEAERVLHDARAICEGTVGITHPKMLTLRHTLAEVYFDWGRTTQDTALWRQSEDVLRAVIGDAPDVIGTSSATFASYLTDLAILLRLTDRHGEAIDTSRRALDIVLKVKEVDAAARDYCLSEHAECLLAGGESRRAVQLLEDSLDANHSTTGQSGNEVATEVDSSSPKLILLGRAYLQEGLLVEAEESFRKAITAAAGASDRQRGRRARGQTFLAKCLIRQSRFTEAGELLEDAESELNAIYGTDDSWTADARDAIMELQAARERPLDEPPFTEGSDHSPSETDSPPATVDNA